MCSAYGLDPRFTDGAYRDAADAAVLAQLRVWAGGNAGATLRPTGRLARNVNPVLTSSSTLELGWWGYLAGGKAIKFTTNTRSERFVESPKPLPRRVIVPASAWFEMQKPSRTWFTLGLPDDELLGLAAFARQGFAEDGSEYLCYSLVMQPALDAIAHVHDRMPLLIAAGFADEWLMSPAAGSELLAGAFAHAAAVGSKITATPQKPKPSATTTLF